MDAQARGDERDTSTASARAVAGGFTLVELVVTITILAIGVVGVMSALGSGLAASRTDHAVTDLDRTLVAFAAAVQGLDYQSCTDVGAPYEADAPAAVADVLPAGWGAKVVAVESWKGAAGAPDFTTDCGDPDAGLQRISLLVVTDTGDDATLTILKRRP